MMKRENSLNYFKLLVYNIFTSMSFILPIRVSYMMIYMVSDSQISLLKMVFSILVFILEIPTGVFADKFGRKLSVSLGTLLFALHALTFILIPNFYGFLLTQLLLGMADAFISGSDSSYVHSYVKTYDSTQSYINVSSRIQAISRPFSLVFSILSSVLFSLSPRLNFMLTFIMGIIAMCIFLSLPSERQLEQESEKINSIFSFADLFNSGLKYFAETPKVLSITLLYALLSGLLIVNFEYYQPFMTDASIPNELFGLIYASFSLLGMLGDLLSKQISDRFSNRRIILLSFLFLALSFLFINSRNVFLVLVAIVLQQLIFSSTNIIYQADLLDKIEATSPSIKTTIMSFSFTIIAMVKIILLFLFAQVLKWVTLYNSYLVLAILCMIILLCFAIKSKKI